MILRWKKSGCRLALVGTYKTREGRTISLTQEKIAEFQKDFKGVKTLEEPFTIEETST